MMLYMLQTHKKIMVRQSREKEFFQVFTVDIEILGQDTQGRYS